MIITIQTFWCTHLVTLMWFRNHRITFITIRVKKRKFCPLRYYLQTNPFHESSTTADCRQDCIISILSKSYFQFFDINQWVQCMLDCTMIYFHQKSLQLSCWAEASFAFQYSSKVTVPVVMIEMKATALKKTTKIISILIWNQRSVDR